MSDDEDIETENLEEYDTVDITDNEQYVIGSQFFENDDNESLAEVLTNLTRVHIALVDNIQELVKQQSAQVNATNNLTKVLQRYLKKKDEK
tara:strand:- start:1534 stop:1806 length:273 start_codon:yes stop_codon:yes gene_type:complete